MFIRFISSLKNQVLNRVMRPLDHVTHRHSPWATAAASLKTESAVQWAQWLQWTMASCMRCPSENMWNSHEFTLLNDGPFPMVDIYIYSYVYYSSLSLSNGTYWNLHFPMVNIFIFSTIAKFSMCGDFPQKICSRQDDLTSKFFGNVTCPNEALATFITTGMVTLWWTNIAMENGHL